MLLPAKQRVETGFTMVEMLVAIMILTLIMTAAMGAVRIGSRSLEAGVSRAGENAEVRAITNILRRQFLQLLPLTWVENKLNYIAFSGNSEQVQFIAPAPDSSRGPGYLLYRLGNGPEQQPNVLVLDYAPFDPGSGRFELPAAPGRQLLGTGLLASYDYFGAQDENDDPDWHTQWRSDSGRLPGIVRMRLSSAGQQWPELLFRVRVGTEQ